MYFNIGPSKKDLYKIILLLICLLFTFRGCAHASEVITYNLGKSGSSNGDLVLWSGNWNNQSILNKQGTLMFSLLVQQVSGNNVKGINIRSGGAEYPCQLGTTSYTLGTDNMFLYSVSCPIMTTSTGVSLIYVATTSSSGWSYQSSQSMSFIIDPDISSIVSVNSSYTQQVIIQKSNEIIQAIQNGSQAEQQTAQNTSEINNTINDSSIDNSSASDLISNSAFQDQNGLQAIIQAPLNFIQSLTSTTCSAISLTIPYFNANVSLPCMSSVYSIALGQQLVNLISMVINGVVLYRYCLKILQIVKDAKNPNKDELEVLEL